MKEAISNREDGMIRGIRQLCGADDRLSDIFFIHAAAKGLLFMSSYLAFFDESGNESDPVLFVAGGISTKESWRDLSVEWADALGEFGIKELHMTDLSNFRGEFSEEFGWDEPKRRKALDRFLKIATRYPIVMLGIGVDCSEFQGVTAEFPDDNRTAYQFCSEMVAFMANMIAVDDDYLSPISCVYADGRQLNTETLNKMEDICREFFHDSRYMINGTTKTTKNGLLPFQVADLIAYEAYRRHREMVVSGWDKRRRFPMRRLAGSLPFRGARMGQDVIREWIRETSRITSSTPR